MNLKSDKKSLDFALVSQPTSRVLHSWISDTGRFRNSLDEQLNTASYISLYTDQCGCASCRATAKRCNEIPRHFGRSSLCAHEVLSPEHGYVPFLGVSCLKDPRLLSQDADQKMLQIEASIRSRCPRSLPYQRTMFVS